MRPAAEKRRKCHTQLRRQHDVDTPPPPEKDDWLRRPKMRTFIAVNERGLGRPPQLPQPPRQCRV